MQRHGFQLLISDPYTYILWEGNNFIIVTVWVDNLLLFTTIDELIECIKANLKAKWKLTDLGEPVKIVRIKITLGDHSITISQCQYLEYILQKKGMDHANPVGMPLDLEVKLEPNPDGNTSNYSNSYVELIGELQFIANIMRPDIAYMISRLSSYTGNLTMQHVSALKHVLRYLSGTKSYSITYGDVLGHPNYFHGYVDASFGNANGCKLTTGYVFKMAGGAITWYSKKQSVTALSSTEAEYIALSEAAQEVCWLQNLFSKLEFTQRLLTTILGNNKGSITITKNPQFHK